MSYNDRQVETMKFPFFGKHDEEESDGEGSAGNHAIVSADDVEIVPGDTDSTLDLTFYEHLTLDAEYIGGSAYADALIPMVGNIADAAGQWNHAIVRFPEGAGWNDLLNRKTPGWEEWKQLGVLKDGKFQPQAAIKQAKLQPVAVANLALQGAAIVVGQAYMTEISKQLEGIESGIAAIQQEMRLEREAKIEARFEKLREYLALYDEISTNSEKRQAVLNGVEVICVDAMEAWKFQVKSMQDLDRRLEKSRRMKDDEVKSRVVEFQSREREAQTAFKLYTVAEQVSMQYDNDFSPARIEREREKMGKCLEEYGEVRSRVQKALGEKIDGVKGEVFAIPEAEDDRYTPQNPLFDVAHAVAHNAPRFTPLALREEAKSRTSSKKDRYGRAASIDDPVAILGVERTDALDRMDFIYNKADTMLVDESGIHFIKMHADKDSHDKEQPGV